MNNSQYPWEVEVLIKEAKGVALHSCDDKVESIKLFKMCATTASSLRILSMNLFTKSFHLVLTIEYIELVRKKFDQYHHTGHVHKSGNDLY
jgi:hypothetical protein